ncbi:MAG TPA: DUF5686 and carboxypeptidase regulatory-like domain-containing protein [Daejeonella sp.]|nr:DUF5686 and carboxypeptidase regulatory-like domain-containing protein [Daejeonella sp.]
MRLVCTCLIFFLCAFKVFPQHIIHGKITDSQGQAVPFVSVYLKNTSKGTSANSEGEYALNTPAGKYEVVFKAIGYHTQSRQIEIVSNQLLNISLQAEVYELKDAVIQAGGEDPAFSIIRKAIRQRKNHLHEVQAYTAEVYIKGLQRMLAAPKKFLGRDVEKMGKEIGLDSNRQGILYLSESESKLSFMQPDKFKEEMIASKTSGSNRAFSFNRASDMRVNFYENMLEWEGLGNRPFISPIAENALFYYTYKLLGASMENGQLVNKIQVIPRRSADPVFRGNIYILEDSWRIHSLDLYLSKEANLNFVDTLKINQQFFPVGEKVWMPSSVRFDFTGGAFGFRFGGYFIALYKNYDLSPQLNKKDFAEVLHISREVNKKDSTYWQQTRPIPLTEEELRDYHKKEALAAKRESKAYLDSLDRVYNKFKPVSFLISGYNWRNRYKKEYYNLSSVVSSVFYNTVEGFGLDYKLSYRKQIDSLSNKNLFLSGKLHYGFSSEQLNGTFSAFFPVKSTNLGIQLGTDVQDLNNLGSISQLGNTVNSLLYERNYLKLYEKKIVQISATQRIGGGVLTSFSAEWANRNNLQNTSTYTFFPSTKSSFTSNNPLSPYTEDPLFPQNQSFKLGWRATYEFSKEYATYPGRRVYMPSKYPRLGLTYTKGIPSVLSSDVDYDLLSFDISKSDIKLGMYGKTSFYASLGKFLNNRRIFYTDYKHFVGNQSLTYTPQMRSYLFLDYYQFSTADKYLEGHWEHNFSSFFLNKIPLIRKLKLQEIAGLNYLATPVLKNYYEVYGGLEYLSFRALYGFSYRDGKKMDSGFRISYGF